MEKRKILLGTNNAHKLQEMKAILASFPVEIVGLQDLSLKGDVEENASTYLGNACIKAGFFSRLSGLPCIADDTGLEVEFLKGAPGIYSARWAGVEGAGRYKANNEKLLRTLKDVPLEKRRARFVSTVVLIEGEKMLLSCEGICPGRIAFAPRGHEGFGYDPLFEVEEAQYKTFAELPDKVKNEISHRAKALKAFQKQFALLQEGKSQ